MAYHSHQIIRALKDRVEKEAELSASLLANAISIEEQATSRFNLLSEYRKGYLESFNAEIARSIGIELYHNYQSFLAKLNDALETQIKVKASASDQVNYQKTIWQNLQKKKLSYEVLIKRTDQQLFLAEKKKDQKLMDEYAVRISRSHVMAQYLGSS